MPFIWFLTLLKNLKGNSDGLEIEIDSDFPKDVLILFTGCMIIIIAWTMILIGTIEIITNTRFYKI